MKPTSRQANRKGFSFFELLVVVTIIVVVAALLLPTLAKQSYKRSGRIACVNNLKQVSLAFRLWASDNRDKYPMQVSTNAGGTMEWTNSGANTFRHFQVMSNEIQAQKLLICPNDIREPAMVFYSIINSNISYFVGLDASVDHPERLLSGDQNIISTNRPVNGILNLVPGQPLSWTRAIHKSAGNITLGDSTLQQLSSIGLFQALKDSGSPTNTWRISLPE